jgi:3D (Asp-Asp-Asp) domain-containing protein
MNRLSSARFNKGLFSGLSILVLFVVGSWPGATSASAVVLKGDRADETASDWEVAASTRVAPNAVGESSTPLSNPVSDVPLGATGLKSSAWVTHDFQATAYCLKGRTASGQHTRPGVIAADPRVLPLGTVVHVEAGRYTGTYTVLDTGGRIKGRKIDIYMPTYGEAVKFGRQRVRLRVLGRASKGAPHKPSAALGEGWLF